MERGDKMQKIAYYNSPVGQILLASDEQGLTGLRLRSDRFYADNLAKDHQLGKNKYLDDAIRWLDLYFEGKNPKFLPKLHLKGKFTPRVDHKGIYPRTKKPIPISVATGGSIESTIRTAELGLPIVYAIIGGDPLHFKPLIKLYRRVAEKVGNELTKMPIAAHSWGWLDQDKEKAIKDYFYPTRLLVDQISTERPQWNGMTYEQYLESVGENGAIFVGDGETVANKIIKVMEELSLTRFYLHLPIASMPHEDVMNTIRIYGEEVVPRVKAYFREKDEKERLRLKWKNNK